MSLPTLFANFIKKAGETASIVIASHPSLVTEDAVANAIAKVTDDIVPIVGDPKFVANLALSPNPDTALEEVNKIKRGRKYEKHQGCYF